MSAFFTAFVANGETVQHLQFDKSLDSFFHNRPDRLVIERSITLTIPVKYIKKENIKKRLKKLSKTDNISFEACLKAKKRHKK